MKNLIATIISPPISCNADFEDILEWVKGAVQLKTKEFIEQNPETRDHFLITSVSPTILEHQGKKQIMLVVCGHDNLN